MSIMQRRPRKCQGILVIVFILNGNKPNARNNLESQFNPFWPSLYIFRVNFRCHWIRYSSTNYLTFEKMESYCMTYILMEKWTVLKDKSGTQATKATWTDRYPVQYLAMGPSSWIIIRLNSRIRNRDNFLCERFFYFMKLKLIQWIMLILGIPNFWLNFLGIRFWIFCSNFEFAWAAPKCVGVSFSKLPIVIFLLRRSFESI